MAVTGFVPMSPESPTQCLSQLIYCPTPDNCEQEPNTITQKQTRQSNITVCWSGIVYKNILHRNQTWQCVRIPSESSIGVCIHQGIVYKKRLHHNQASQCALMATDVQELIMSQWNITACVHRRLCTRTYYITMKHHGVCPSGIVYKNLLHHNQTSRYVSIRDCVQEPITSQSNIAACVHRGLCTRTYYITIKHCRRRPSGSVYNNLLCHN